MIIGVKFRLNFLRRLLTLLSLILIPKNKSTLLLIINYNICSIFESFITILPRKV